jgi:hypothetical protein
MLVLFTSLFKKIKEGSEFRTRTRKPPKICARGFYLLDSRVLKMVDRILILFSSPTKKVIIPISCFYQLVFKNMFTMNLTHKA